MNYEFDIMISYCWAEKTVCKKIFQSLRTGGYRVWFDEEDMHRNTCAAMAMLLSKILNV